MAKKEYIGENRLSQLLTLLKSKIDAKVDKVTGKGLSTNDYTTAEKNKLASIPSIGDGTLKIQKNGTDVATFTANQAGNATANITVPTSKSDIGLGNVDNTSDANKPVSTAQQAALDGKVDKAAGYGLSKNDYSDADKASVTAFNELGLSVVNGFITQTIQIN
jgi:hypothetical protein